MNTVDNSQLRWKELIVSFFEAKIAATTLYKARKFIEKKNQEIANEKEEKKKKKLLNAKEKKQKELEKCRKVAPSTEIRHWFEENSKKKVKDENERIVKVTHALRFLHSSASAQGLIVKQSDANSFVLSTSSFLKELVFDMAHNNGSLVSISRFLALKLGNEQIFDLVANKDYSFLKPFAEDDEQLNRWGIGFLSLIKIDEIKTGDKTRQIYFPIKKIPETDSDYHLLIPLFASSLCEEIYTSVNHTKYDKAQKQHAESIKKQNDNGGTIKYLSGISIKYPDLGIQKFGGAQPQNVSMLNKGRSWKARKEDKTTWGVTYLFSCQPPTWQSQLKPPINRISLFDAIHNSTIKTEIDYLRDFLLRFKHLDLSIKDPKRKRHLIRWVENIIDECLFYIASIQNRPAGWSAADNIRLKSAHQYLLDPYRSDEDFQAGRQNTDWQAVVIKDFAQWLNRQLRGYEKQFTPKAEHTRLWKKLIEQLLREHMEPIEQEIKQAMKEAV